MCLRLVGNVSGVCTVHNLLVGCLFTACLSEQIKWEWYLSHVSIYTVSYFSFCYFYYVVKNMLCWNVESGFVYTPLFFIYACVLHSSHVNTFFPSLPPLEFHSHRQPKILPQGLYCVVTFQCTITLIYNLIRSFMCVSVHVAQPLEYHHTCVKCSVYSSQPPFTAQLVIFGAHILFVRMHTFMACVYHYYCKIQCMMILCQNNCHEF